VAGVREAPDRHASWRETYERLVAREPTSLTGQELDLLADALFWLDRPDRSAAARREAYAAHLAAGAIDDAALAAWRLFYDHFLVGETAVASGWLERARGHVGAADSSLVAAWVAVAEADCRMAEGDPRAALRHARRALETARSAGDDDLLAMGLQATGRALCEAGRLREGMALLDEAMVAVVHGEVGALFTGWVFCNLLSTCHDVADLDRATQWSDAAMRWCDGLWEGRMYPGLCRVYAVELSCLRGAWDSAAVDARRACVELVAHDPRYAGEAFYLVGEMCRLTGDLDGAEEAFTQAHRLGRVPQPGLALVRLAQGRSTAAVRALRLERGSGPTSPLRRVQLLAAQIEAELRVGETARARDAAHVLAGVARTSPNPFLSAIAAAAEGRVLLAEGDPPAAIARLRAACAACQELGLPYEAARTQVVIGTATREAGDEDTARLELGAALATFVRLGARLDAQRVEALVDLDRQPTPLTEREVEVLRLVARGCTNREVGAELFLSEHTVARHLSNTFAKVGATSRAAATAYAYEHGLI
jgi:DNA-binding NarL/FixJ family response regulator